MRPRTLVDHSAEICLREVDARQPVTSASLYPASLLLILILWNSCVAAADALRISLATTPLVLPFYVAETQGYLAAEGVDLKIKDVAGGVRALDDLLSGSADLATASETVVMFNSFKSADFAVVATIAISDNDLKIVSRDTREISGLRQLSGKRVGNVAASAAHYYLDLQLVLSGVDPASVDLIDLQPDAMATALENGEVDAIAIWEPYAFIASTALPDARVLPTIKGYDLRFNLIAHKRLNGVRDDELVKLLRALDRANQFIAAEPAKAQAILKKRLKLEQSFIDWVWPIYRYRLVLEQSLIQSLEGEARWARRNGHVTAERSPNYLRYVHPGPLRKVRPAAVSILE
jgi:ABC-type nitrate/sulfonate/bicarbonate transport system substrate-binding protein